MTYDDAIETQRSVALAALTERLIAEDLPMPPCFRIQPQHAGCMLIEFGSNAHCPGDPFVQLKDAWDRENPFDLKPWVVDALVAGVHVSHRRWAQSHRPETMPSWAVLVHPLLLAVLLSHEPDRRRMPIRTISGRRVPHVWTIDNEGDTAHPGRLGTSPVKAWYADGYIQCERAGVLMEMGGGAMAAVTVASIPYPKSPDIGRTTISLPAVIPETLLGQVVGRRLGDVVSLPTSGDAEIDRAAADCVILECEELPNGYRLRVSHTTLVPYGVPPTPELKRAMSLAPMIG